MTRFVIDPPTLVSLARDGRPPAPAHRLVAPNSVRSEALQDLLEQVVRGDLAETDGLRLHESMTELKIRLLGDRVSRRTAWKIAREHGWTIRDAEYLAITRLQGDALVTSDAKLAAKAQGLVPLADYEMLFAG